MNILKHVTIKNLKLNKKTTTLIVIGIIISTIYINLISSLYTSIINMGVKYKKEIEKDIIHANFVNIPISEINNFKNNKNIEDIFMVQNIEVLVSEDWAEENWVNDWSVKRFSKNIFTSFYKDKIRGKLPKNENEILIGSTKQWNGKEYNIGDTINLQIVTKDELDEDTGSIVHKTYDKEYKIVGIIDNDERSSWFGNTSLVTCINEDNMEGKLDLSVRFSQDGLKNIYKTIANILNVDEKDVINSKKDNGGVGFYLYTKYLVYVDKNLIGLETNKIDNYFIINFRFNTISYINCSIFASLIIMLILIKFLKSNLYIFFIKNFKQYGILRSVGTTNKQIRKIIFLEATLLMIIAIPVGLILGTIISNLVANIFNYYMEKALFVKDIFKYSFSYKQILSIIIFEAVTVYFSAFLVAKKISKISPMDLIKNSTDIKNKKTNKFKLNIFGVYKDIASKSIKRNKKKYRPIILSFIISISMFILLYNANNMTVLQQRDEDLFDFDKIAEYNLSLEIKENDLKKVNEILNSNSIQDYSIIRKNSFVYESGESQILVYSIGERQYKKYIEELGLNFDEINDKAILVYGEYFRLYHNYADSELKDVDYIEGFNLENIIWQYDSEDGKPSIMNESDINKFNIVIGKVEEKSPFGLYNSTEPCLIVSDEFYNKNFKNENINIYIKTDNPYEIETEIKKVLKEEFFIAHIELRNEITVSNSTVVFDIFYDIFIVVVYIIIFIDLISTISINLELQKQEFAIFKSIGMTKKEVEKMVRIEYLLIGIKSLILGLFIGNIGSYLSYRFYIAFFYITFENPPILGSVIAILLVSLIISILIKYSIYKLNKQSIIETIRNENI